MSAAVTETVSETQVESFRADGFVQVDDVLTGDELNALRDEIADIYRTGRGGRKNGGSAYARVLDQRVNIWRDNEVVRRIVLHPRLAEMARRLAGVGAVRLWHDHALLKQPGDSKPTPWHQDLPYWPMNEPGALSIWIALDDVDERNGAMSFIPGSHRVGSLPGINLVQPQDIFAMVPKGQLAGTRPVTARLRAGSCTFHDGRTFHYAAANTTDRPRPAMVVIYMPDGTTYSGKGHMCTDGLGLAVGGPISGETFPILASAPS